MGEDDKTPPEKLDLNGPELLQVFKRGVQFTEELIQENERLRFRLVQLEEENRMLARQAMAPASYAELLTQMKVVEEEKASLLERFQAVECENLDFKERYQEIEEENNRLANLYVASYALHSTLDLKAVVQRCFEILINLVGTRDFALYIHEHSLMVPVRAEGRSLRKLASIRIGQGVAGRAAKDKLLYLSAEDTTKPSLSKPKACVPLLVGERMVGMFVVFSFLQQKTSVTELDRELFKLLAGHAATALYSARLHAESDGVKQDARSYLKLLEM